ncbi:G-gamma domain-containing protein [Rhizoctonia solani AG-1 IA]|uniref:Guanine nucleotide-binding protein subunit gamma n=1 Tax=Thanatephorus cucumeris (strain AG1-IA) TaxID=983506 RepID=L8X7D3_THACA|nr:G-gamma domain-containing protein [Rhizoctonia solani AG-1 IA]
MNARNAKQSMAELKLRRVIEHNQRLKEDLARPRLRVSEAGASLIRYCKTTKDHLVPSVWGPVGKGEDPYCTKRTDPPKSAPTRSLYCFVLPYISTPRLRFRGFLYYRPTWCPLSCARRPSFSSLDRVLV